MDMEGLGIKLTKDRKGLPNENLRALKKALEYTKTSSAHELSEYCKNKIYRLYY